MKNFRYLTLLLFCPAVALGQLDFEQEPISYSSSTPTDLVQQLADRLRDGSCSLKWDDRSGYLKSLLSALEIPESSQTLVFSKTSLQVGRISPRTPRAIYFNDDVYVGWVQRGDIIEISAADPALGATFYTLKQSSSNVPAIMRETSRCLQCHGSTHTRRIPGHIVRSVFSDKTGLPVFRLGTHISAPSSTMAERFGGWYVTGNTGDSKHMGNAWIDEPDESEVLDQTEAFNVEDLSNFVNTAPYLNQHSDVVAQLVLQHQVHVHNVLTAANHSGVLTERDAVIMNKALDRDAEFQSESTERRYNSAADKVLKALLCCKEASFDAQISGTSSFQSEFERRGPFDSNQRSLRKIGGRERLLRYPCSFLIYSEPFRRLHPEVRSRVILDLHDILASDDESLQEDFQHLSKSDRIAIREILQDTNALQAETEAQRTEP